jgi:hypothetical protein
VQQVYRVQLPGDMMLGEGKPENQNHAVIFTRGEALQTIDMNQVKVEGRGDVNWGGCVRCIAATLTLPN